MSAVRDIQDADDSGQPGHDRVQGSAIAGQEASAPFVGRRYRWWADRDGNAAAVCRGDVSHLRTKAGEHEVDLIVETVDGGVLGIEVKLASTVDDNDMRHVLWLHEQVPEQVVDLACYNNRSGCLSPGGWSGGYSARSAGTVTERRRRFLPTSALRAGTTTLAQTGL